MSNLGLDIAASGIAADTTALDTAAQNLANISTAGYARETVNDAPVEAAVPGGSGQGVLVTAVTQTTSSLYDQLNLAATAGLGFANESAIVSQAVQNAVPEATSSGFQNTLNQFWSDLSSFASEPQSAAAASTVIQDAQNVANGINEMAAQFSATAQQLQSDLEGPASSTTSGGLLAQANQLIKTIAQLNAGIAAGNGGGLDVNALVDSRRAALTKLAGLLNIRTAIQPTGEVTVWSGGIELVQQTNATTLHASGSAANADLAITTTGGLNVPVGGQIGALLQGVDVTIPSYQSQLDNLANSLASTLNPLQAAGVSSGGTPGSANPAIFVDQGSTSTFVAGAGSAATIAVAPALVANPSLISTASPGTIGASIDAGTVQQMAAVGAQANGPDNVYQQLVASVGNDGASANAAQATAQQLSNATTAELSSVEGVNTNEETVHVLQAQQNFQASAQVINAINASFQSLLQAV